MADSTSQYPEEIEYVDTKERFDALGFAGPFALQSSDHFDPGTLSAPAPEFCTPQVIGWHVASPPIKKLLSSDMFSARVQALCGSNFVVWRSGFFQKKAGLAEIGWHHDKHFQTSTEDALNFNEAAIHYSALFAFNDMGVDNGRLEVIPGSHKNLVGYERDVRPMHKKTDLNDHFIRDIPEHLMAMRRSVRIPAGSFFLFHSGLLHRSLPYTTGDERLAFAIRLAPSTLQVPGELSPFYLPL